MLNYEEQPGQPEQPDAASATHEPYVLVVEPTLEWRKFLGNTLKKAGIRFEAVSNARIALAKIGLEQDDQFTAVITDGLHGDWTGIVESAREKGASVVLTSKSSLTVGKAQRKQIPAFLKNDLKDKNGGSIALLLFAVAPDTILKNRD